GSIRLPGAIIVCAVGVLIGDAFLFFLGRTFGYRVFRLPGFRSIFTESRIQIARQKVLHNSKFICFTARFLPGLRAPVFLTSGIMGVRPIVFLILDGTAALVSVPVWMYVGWLFGSNLDEALSIAMKTQRYFIGGVVVLVAIYLWFKSWAARRERK